MATVLETIESENAAASELARLEVESARAEYRTAALAGAVDDTPPETVRRWMALLNISTSDARADRQAVQQMNELTAKSVPTDADIDAAFEVFSKATKAHGGLAEFIQAETGRRLHAVSATQKTWNDLKKAKAKHEADVADLRTRHTRIL